VQLGLKQALIWEWKWEVRHWTAWGLIFLMEFKDSSSRNGTHCEGDVCLAALQGE